MPNKPDSINKSNIFFFLKLNKSARYDYVNLDIVRNCFDEILDPLEIRFPYFIGEVCIF